MQIELLARDENCREAIKKAKEETMRTGRKYIVRENGRRFYVVPLYLLGMEGMANDPGYEMLGKIVEESL